MRTLPSLSHSLVDGVVCSHLFAPISFTDLAQQLTLLSQFRENGCWCHVISVGQAAVEKTTPTEAFQLAWMLGIAFSHFRRGRIAFVARSEQVLVRLRRLAPLIECGQVTVRFFGELHKAIAWARTTAKNKSDETTRNRQAQWQSPNIAVSRRAIESRSAGATFGCDRLMPLSPGSLRRRKHGR